MVQSDAPYLGVGQHELGYCNSAEEHVDPEGSHARCPLVWHSRHEGGYRSCKCECHDPGDDEIRSAIEAERGQEERSMAAAQKKTSKKATTKAPAERPDCLCGCGEKTGGGRFRPGHDAKLKSQLQHRYREATTKRDRDKIQREFESLGWGHFVPVLDE